MSLNQDITQALRIRPGTVVKGKEVKFCCFCHDDKNPSASWNESKGAWQCFVCGGKGGAKDAAKHLGLNSGTTGGTTQPEPTQGLTLKQLAEAKGLDIKVLKKMGWSDAKFKDKPAVSFGNGKYRIALTGKDHFRTETGAETECKLYEGTTLECWIVEGETDTATCVEHGITCVCVPGANNWKPTPKIPKPTYIWQEPDKGGEQFVKSITKDLPHAFIIRAPSQAKDINELARYGNLLERLEELKATAIPASDLNRPDIKHLGNVFHFVWPMGVDISVTRVKEHSDIVTGEVIIKYKEDTLTHGMLNMSSIAARRGLGKELDTRAPDVDWTGVLNTLTLTLLERLREGEPVVQVGCEPITPRPKAAIRDVQQDGSLVVADHPNLIYGPGGVGKSTFACLLAALVQQGNLGNHIGLKSQQYSVLYLDWETTFDEINETIQQIVYGLISQGEEVNPELTVNYLRMYLPLTSDLERVQATVQEQGTTLLIADSLGSACGAEPESAAVILAYFAALRSLNITTLTIDHTNREGSLFGSIYKFNQARCVWEMKKTQKPGEDYLHVGLIHKKMNRGKLLKPIGFKISYSEDDVTFDRVDLRKVDELAENMPVRDRMSDLLTRTGPMEMKDIAEELCVDYDTVKKAVQRDRRDRGQLFVNIAGNIGLKYESND